LLLETKIVCDQQHPWPHGESNGPQQTAADERGEPYFLFGTLLVAIPSNWSPARY
jgi:hypothetical protein